jgi:hypothetical protein
VFIGVSVIILLVLASTVLLWFQVPSVFFFSSLLRFEMEPPLQREVSGHSPSTGGDISAKKPFTRIA